MKPFIKIEKVIKNYDSVNILFQTDDSLNQYFNIKEFNYSLLKCNIVPDSILIIPFICNVLPIVWLKNAILIVDKIDKSFLYSIEQFKLGYVNMYPNLKFNGSIQYKIIEENIYEPQQNLVLFSGGIDAICTVLRHKDENLKLLTLWGSADFPIKDTKGWQIHWNNINFNASQLGLHCDYIKTNFCDFIPLWGEELNKLVAQGKDSWWHGFQHGIGIIGHAAPYAYINKIKKVYIASSFDESRKPYTCASDPTIDNYVKFGCTEVIHDGYEWNRQEKIKFIVNAIKTQQLKLKIHVCLRQYQLENCCKCEKCYRTILGLLAEGISPKSVGFNFDDNDLPALIDDITHHIYLGKNKILTYKQIQDRVIENKDHIQSKLLIQWMSKVNLDKINDNIPQKIFTLKTNIKKWIRKNKMKLK